MMANAVSHYRHDVLAGHYPNDAESYHWPNGLREEFEKWMPEARVKDKS